MIEYFCNHTGVVPLQLIFQESVLVPTSTSPGLPFRPPFLATWQRLKDAKRLQQQQAEQHTQANSLRRYRLQQNLSYKELSQLSGLDCSNLRKLEQGHIRARASTVQKLALALQIPLSHLEYLGQGRYPGSIPLKPQNNNSILVMLSKIVCFTRQVT